MGTPGTTRLAIVAALLSGPGCGGGGEASGPGAVAEAPAEPVASARDPGPVPDEAPEPLPDEAPGSPDAAPDLDAGEAEDGADAGEPPPFPAERPADFGVIVPPQPPPAADTLTVHALAGYEVVAVYTEPDLKSTRLGYLRFGQRTMVTPKIEDAGEGCKKGFHGLPIGGFACASKGLIVSEDKAPYMYLPPPPPRVEEPLPYDYGVIAKDGTPMWWRIADADEVKLADDKYQASAAAREKAEPKSDSKSTSTSTSTSKSKSKSKGESKAKGESKGKGEAPKELPGVGDEPPAPVAELTEEEKAERARKEEEARVKAEERAKELAAKAAKLPLNSGKPFMEKGFMITISERVREKGRGWWRTTRGGFIESSRAWRRKTKDFHGGEIPEGTGFPFGFVMAEKASATALNAKGKLTWKRGLEYRELLIFAEEVDVDGVTYLVTHDGLHVRKKHLRLAVPGTRPDDIAPWEPWIDVSLEHQILVAYEGDTPVYATLVSTGRKGTEEESFATPKGAWRIRSKHISSSMDGNTASDGAYSIQDVPWAMFFEGSYALHGAFWHSRFGNRRSHGCINLGPTDARWLFYWTTPLLPEGWHGVNAQEDAPGTMIVVH